MKNYVLIKNGLLTNSYITLIRCTVLYINQNRLLTNSSITLIIKCTECLKNIINYYLRKIIY